jgi:hypothetical protein
MLDSEQLSIVKDLMSPENQAQRVSGVGNKGEAAEVCSVWPRSARSKQSVGNGTPSDCREI